MKYDKELMNEVYAIKESLKCRDKKAVEQLMKYTNYLYIKNKRMSREIGQQNRLMTQIDELTTENERLKNKLKRLENSQKAPQN